MIFCGFYGLRAGLMRLDVGAGEPVALFVTDVLRTDVQNNGVLGPDSMTAEAGRYVRVNP